MYKKFIKRLLDIILSLFGLIILSPVILIVAILVRIKLGSPVIFKQKRPGKNEKIFTLYKFRSMSDKKDENGKLLPDKERLTKFGKVLRATSLDELPELVNILKGDMSLIGPRPLAVCYLPYYNEIEKHRHDVRPGLTGLAQINGRNALNWEDRFNLDIEYVNNITFFNDIKILFKTIYKVIKKDDVVVSGTGSVKDFNKYRIEQLEKIKEVVENNFFNGSKYNRARSAIQGYMGKFFVDNYEKPNIAVALIGKNCFIDGNENTNNDFIEKTLMLLDNYYKVIIANNKYFDIIEKVFKNKFEIASRFATRKNAKFNAKYLEELKSKKMDFYSVKKIYSNLYEKIKNTDSYVTNIEMSSEYEKNGIGFCAINNENNEIIGVITSNAVYDDGIEINIKIFEQYRRKGIGSVLSAYLILECLKRNIYPYWDAFNTNSLKLAQKLGYELDEEYRTYKINCK